MMRFLLPLIVGALPLMAAFPQPVQQVRLVYGQREATVRFTADSDVRKARALCDCTTLSYKGKEIAAQVDVSGFAQSVEKQLEATTADGKITRLTMQIIVPQAVEFSARSLHWKKGAAATPQTLRIRIPKGSPVQSISEAAISGEAFDYTTHTVKPGAEYTVSITPKTTEKRALNRLIIRTDHPDPRYAAFIIYLSIQP